MARNKGQFKFAANFEVQAQEALDPRVVVDTKADLINKETWPYDGDTIYLYNGLIVAVVADKSMYMLIDKTKITQSDYSGWKQLDVSAAQTVEIIDNLTSESTTAALSANQGKVLDEKISTLQSKLTAIFTYKGTKTTYAELAAEEASAAVGDVWNIEEAHDNVPAGTNWVWNGTTWDALAGSIDLSGYVQKEAGKELIPSDKLQLIDTNASAVEELNTQLEQLQTTVEGIETEISQQQSFFEVPSAVLSLTSESESGDILSAVGGNWANFCNSVKVAQPIVAKKLVGANAQVVALNAKYEETDSANNKVTIEYIDGLNKISIAISCATDTYSAVVTTTSVATDAALEVVKSTADAATEALVVLNGEVGTVGSVKYTATQIATTIMDEGLSWIEVD